MKLAIVVLGVRIGGTLGDIDPLNKVPFKRARSRVQKGYPLRGLPNDTTCVSVRIPDLPQPLVGPPRFPGAAAALSSRAGRLRGDWILSRKR